MTKILLMVLIFNVITFSMGQMIQLRPSDFRRLSRMGREYSPFGGRPLEPTCEELKAMWRFSRRQARAAEITNDIPTFKDPFAYNIWQKYPKMRSLASAPRPTGRIRSKPIYGRVVHTAPSDHPRVLNPEPPKYYGVVRYFEPDEEEQTRRNYGLAGTFGPPNRRQKGSFQRLKEMVWADRMKDLHDERLVEPSRPRLVLPVDVNPPAPAQAPAPISASAPVPHPAPVPTPHPPPSPAPAGVPLPLKDIPLHVSRPYDSAFQGQESSDYIHPYNQNRSSRLKIISDYFNRDFHENIGIDDDEDNNEELVNEDPVYGTPYRLRQVFLDDAPNFEF